MPGSRSAACRGTCSPSALLLLTRRSLLPLHWPCERLAKALHQMFSCWKLPAFHRSFGFRAAPSVQGLFSNAAAPFRPITSTWIHFSRAFPMLIGSFDSLHSLSPSQFFLNCLPGFFISAWMKMLTSSRWRTGEYKSGSIRRPKCSGREEFLPAILANNYVWPHA